MNLDAELIDLISGGSSIRRIEDALRNGANPNSRNVTNTALMLAARWGYLEIVVLLLKEGANPNIVNGGGDTALSWAELGTNERIIEILRKETKMDKLIPIDTLPISV